MMVMNDEFWKEFYDIQFELHECSRQLEQLRNRLFNLGMIATGFKHKKRRVRKL